MLDQVAEKIEFRRRKGELCVRDVGGTLLGIQRQGTIGKLRLLLFRSGCTGRAATQDGADPGHQLQREEGDHQIVITAK